MGSYKQRLLLTPCVRARLAELDHVIASDRVGRPIAIHGLSHWPVSFSLRTSVWAGRTGDIEPHPAPDPARLPRSTTTLPIRRAPNRRAERMAGLGEFDDATTRNYI